MAISNDELHSRLKNYRRQNWENVQTPAWQIKIVEQQMSFNASPVIQRIVSQHNLDVRNLRYLDIGSGIGDYVIAARKLGIDAVGIEPDQIGVGSFETSLSIAKDRADDQSWFYDGVGESLPFDNESFDLITMNQVLEHVQDVDKVLEESFRVLKVGGVLLLNSPNYLSFYEPHYKVFWFPLFPRFLARIYLRLRGRNVSFLNGINYVTRSKLSRSLGTLPCSFYDEQLKYLEQRMVQFSNIQKIYLRIAAILARALSLDKLAIKLYVNFMVRGMSFVVTKTRRL